MSQPQPKHAEFTEFVPQTERRTPVVIASVPETAMTEDADPTQEIRSLIEQLQKTAREARAQARSAEQERDALTLQFARAEEQIEALRETELDLRSHFVEVTSLIQERDTALAESERRSRELAETARKLEDATRERGEAQRERDEAARQRNESAQKLESIRRSNAEQGQLLGETQRQIVTIRQARDGAHAQILELANKLSQADDRAADLEYLREKAEKSAQQAADETAEYRRQCDATALDRDATARQVEELTRELDGQRRKLLDLAAQKSALHQADSEQAAALEEARAQLGSVAQERDVARARAQEQARELEELRSQFQEFRDKAGEAAAREVGETREKFAALESQARTARHTAQNLSQELEAVRHQLAALQTLGEAAAAREAETQRQIAELTGERDDALTSAQAAKEQIGQGIRERAQAAEDALALEAQLADLRSRCVALESAGEEAQARQAELGVLQKRFEKQRLESIDLAARLQAAQGEIRELSALLAEARLQVKFATAASRATKGGATKSDFDGIVRASAVVREPEPADDAEDLPGVGEALSEKDARSAVGAMRQCFQSFTKRPDDLSLLNELYCHVHGLSERARTSGYLALHRLCAAFSALARGLYETPEQLTPSALGTIQQTIELLATLVRDGSHALAPDPAKAVVCIVDDDPDNCDAMRMAMESAFLRIVCVQDPASALGELAAEPYDLILLDLHLPEMNGFELCRHIRELPLHRDTPVVFITGCATTENRAQAAACGGGDFVAKPFNLRELSVKATSLILQNQLQPA